MFLNFNIFLILSCSLYGQIDSKCKMIHDYKNGLPSLLKTLAKNDNLGALLSLGHRSYSALVNNYTNWVISKEDCRPRVVTIGTVSIKFSLHPKGCCSYCCLIDRVEDDIFIYVEHKNKTSTKMSLATKRRKGELAATGFNSTLKTIVLLHGLSEVGATAVSTRLLTQAYLKRNESYNILRVDYSDLTPLPWYVEGLDNIKLIAEAIAKFIRFYHKTGELAIENIHIIGISLGAQLAGLLGKEVGKFKKVSRVTGLDPAFALYPDTDKSQRICDDDAEFVDIIHTDAGNIGFPFSLGHADFYIHYNSEEVRPGCSLSDLAGAGALISFLICDHVRSLVLYLESLHHPHAYPFVTTSNGTAIGYMGFLASKTTTIGDYHFTVTNNNSRKVYESFLDSYNKLFNY